MLSSQLSVVNPDPLEDAFEFDGTEQPKRVLLMCPPFQSLGQASLSIATLATLLRTNDLPCAEAYVHYDFARCFGEDTYHKVVNLKSGLACELLFAEALHSSLASAEANQQLTELYGSREQRSENLAAYAELCLQHVRRYQPDIVGSTTSFNQLLASLWLGRIVKREFPNILFVLGGATCAEPMAYSILKGYPEVDLVVSGFGEFALLKLARGAKPRGRLVSCDAMPDFDSLPIPDYTQVIEQAGQFSDEKFMLSFESSRGCWWGQKNHCSFCGLNGSDMRFRLKSDARVVSEVRALWDTYGKDLCATDNILAVEHLHGAIVELGGFETGPKLLYEIKTNLTQGDIAALRRARVRTLQPGIESLSTNLLRLLKKGTSTIRNLAMLKWCREYGIAAYWIMLCGIPGETFQDYDEQLLLIDNIPHLQPPLTANTLRIDRFSPYFKNFADYGWEGLEPFDEYRWHHPHLDEAALYDIAYHFKGQGGVQAGPYLKRMRASVKDWRERFAQNEGLFYHPEKGLVRNLPAQAFSYGRNPLLERIIEATNDITPIEAVTQAADCNRSVIEQLVKSNILYVEKDKVINLVIRTHMFVGAGAEPLTIYAGPPL
jgi:ribosomal peptide maturation radical SAM protein 1